ncbi:family S53 protease-like protein [Mycena amicta]|nr:family S53 protease-like protein [Mycena amicta]
MKRPALLIAAILLAVAAGPPRDMAVQESRETPGAGFVDSGPAPGSHQLKLRVQLKSNNLAGLEEALYAASDPASALYGQYLTADNVADFVKPSDETLQNVTEWLQENHIDFSAISPAKDTLQIILPVSEANKLLSTNFSVFTHVESGQTSVRTLEYSIPATLFPHIDLIYPTTSFARLRAAPQFNAVKANQHVERRDIPTNCNLAITPTCLQDIYSIPTTPATQPTNQIAVAGFLKQYANNQDLEDFLEQLRPDMNPATNFEFVSLDGGINPQAPMDAGVEANLDIQYTVGLATGVPVQFISVGLITSDGVAGFIDIINTLIMEETSNPRPSVLTTSYGFDEDELSRAMAAAMCNAYLQLSALGTTILFASGDGGVGGTVKGENCTNFIPTAPSDCPFVTSVGSTTQIVEVAASFSSGGFSNYFPIPSYQATAVASYLSAIGSTNSGRFNRMGRAFPDISTQGVNFVVTVASVTGGIGPVQGTSCSAPTLASMIALLNDELISAGKPQLGFLNPLLYSEAGRTAITDITSGSNPGCNTDGFPALPGWDAVTGLGTLNYAALRAVVMYVDAQNGE